MNHHRHHGDNHPLGQTTLSEKGKLRKLLEHWIKHNEEHAETYLEWSKKIDSESLGDVVSLLEEASKVTVSINDLLERAVRKLL